MNLWSWVVKKHYYLVFSSNREKKWTNAKQISIKLLFYEFPFHSHSLIPKCHRMPPPPHINWMSELLTPLKSPHVDLWWNKAMMMMMSEKNWNLIDLLWCLPFFFLFNFIHHRFSFILKSLRGAQCVAMLMMLERKKSFLWRFLYARTSSIDFIITIYISFFNSTTVGTWSPSRQNFYIISIEKYIEILYEIYRNHKEIM